MSYESLSNLLGSLEFLYAMSEPTAGQISPRQRRQYVRQEHIRFIETRFRIFDEYLVTRRPEGFLEFIKLLPDEFEDLYERIGSGLEHPRTHLGPVTGRHRLMIYLRFVTQRRTFTAYALDIGMGKTTVSNVVEEVAEAIIRGISRTLAIYITTNRDSVLHNVAFPPLTRARLEEVARKTQARFSVLMQDVYNDSVCLEARPLWKYYWNYKHYHSIILLAICDCDYRFMAYDVGAPGRRGDAGVFRNSAIKRWLERHDDVFPPTRGLGRVGPVQYHFLVDGGFAQGPRFIRPYREPETTTGDRRRFNRQLSGARHMIESTFGLLAQRFQILMTRMTLTPERAKRLVVSLMILHNMLPRRQDSLAEVERFRPAQNAYHPLRNTDLLPTGGAARDLITQYYVDLYGHER
ncbi:unnamed protein product [Cylicocyclus nassatus]|uniref:DDE Tnp4 domain-containing protein n=1 Tax=Cylicocyclus nassatus TaxID=53992 RepID=A0AA36H1R0_CYLNA|nr:unnamed protein product [Cylicocyclus nassatus]CAJ0602179.1 unnamed protein product [Cylicocyclus nassatus]